MPIRPSSFNIRPFLPLLLPPSRAIALFLGSFTLLNLAANLPSPGFDLNVWFLDIRPLPAPLGELLLLAGALALLTFALFPTPPRLRLPLRLIILALTLLALANSLTFFRLLRSGSIHSAFPIPFTLFVATSLLLIQFAISLPPVPLTRPAKLSLALTLIACAIGFPLLQIFCFGHTNYSRPADAAVVFGAQAYSDGTLSPALKDRTRTAIALYQAGLVHTLIFSGGPVKSSPWTEPQAMRAFALAAGIPDSAILLDESGLNTDATVRNTLALARAHRFTTLLAISHDYHLPRIKMRFQRALESSTGVPPAVEVRTVPATELEFLTHRPFFITREIAALWAYYLRPLVAR